MLLCTPTNSEALASKVPLYGSHRLLGKNVLPHLQLRRLQFVRQATVAWLTSCSLACVGNKITLNTEGEADTFQFPQKTNCFVHFPSFFIGNR